VADDLLQHALRGASAAALIVLLGACARPVGDFGRAEPDVIHDDLMPAAGAFRARQAGEPVSDFNLSDEETEMANRIWRFETSGHTRDWFFDTIAEWRRTRLLPPGSGPVFTPDRYYAYLHGTAYQSARVRYATMTDDIEADLATIPDTFAVICKVETIDRQRQLAAANLPAGAAMEGDLRARLAENGQQISAFADALRYRYDSYDYALDHLLIETPYPVARTVDLDLKRLEVEVAIAERGDFCGTGEVRSGSPDLRELSILPRYEHEAPPRAGPQVGS
jgi:hypothetical protein